MPQPLFPDIGLLAFVPDPWGEYWEARHHVMARLGRYFHVVWLDPVHEWRSVPRVLRERRPARAAALPAGLHLYRPPWWLPQVYRPRRIGEWFAGLRTAQAAKLLPPESRAHLVAYLWRPHFVSVLRHAPFQLVCYHIDDEYTFSPVERPIGATERELFARADQVFIHSPELFRKKGGLNPGTTFVPNGVDYERYATPCPEPDDLAAIPHPRIGYTGYLKNQLDWELLDHLAAERPRWSFVFVGALRAQPGIAEQVSRLARRANVHFLGGKPVSSLAAYPQHFDACIMPYRHDDYTKYIFPMKLHEYLAGGRPVVASRIPSLVPYTDLLQLAAGPAEWLAGLEAALGPAANASSAREARRAEARTHDWELLAAIIARRIVGRLAPGRADSIAEALRTAGVLAWGAVMPEEIPR